jgi:thiol-disulfide isomerase/thioredoxin
MLALTIYSRPGCHLCDDMKTVVSRVARTFPGSIAIDEIDISTDPQLESRYGVEIPVLLLNGRKVAKYRIGEEDLRKLLADRMGGAGQAGEAGRPG